MDPKRGSRNPASGLSYAFRRKIGAGHLQPSMIEMEGMAPTTASQIEQPLPVCRLPPVHNSVDPRFSVSFVAMAVKQGVIAGAEPILVPIHTGQRNGWRS